MKKFLCLLLLILMAAALVWVNADIPKQGYYLYTAKGDMEAAAYYYQNGSWFRGETDAAGDRVWAKAESIDQTLRDRWKIYYLGLIYPQNYPLPDFAETSFYAEHVKQNVYDPET